MTKWGNSDFKELTEFRDKLAALDKGAEVDRFCEACARELAARLLAKVIKRTPVGQYPSGKGKTGGTLRRGWTGGASANAVQYASSLVINRVGNTYVIEITNPVGYAPYVEFGHRTREGKGFVTGKFMMTDSEKELSALAPKILQKKLDAYLKGVFK